MCSWITNIGDMHVHSDFTFIEKYLLGGCNNFFPSYTLYTIGYVFSTIDTYGRDVIDRWVFAEY